MIRPDTPYPKSESGWIDAELFMVRLKKIFAVPQHSVLLLIDGHKSHVHIDVINFCHTQHIHCMWLSSNLSKIITAKWFKLSLS